MDFEAVDAALMRDGVVLNEKAVTVRHAAAEAGDKYRHVAATAAAAEEQVHRYVANKRAAVNQMQALVMPDVHAEAAGGATAAAAAAPPATRHDTAVARATVKRFSVTISVADAAVKEASATWKRVAWDATMAHTRWRELETASTAVMRQLIQVTNQAESDKRALVRRLVWWLVERWYFDGGSGETAGDEDGERSEDGAW